MMHCQENLNSLIGFPGGDIPLRYYRKGFGGRAEAMGFHLGHEDPDGPVVAQPGRDVDHVVEGGRGEGVDGEVG